MPSGARKRKAAKKKHEKVTPITHFSANPSYTTQGDLKHHESNGVQKSTEDVKTGYAQMEKGAGQENGGVQVEGELERGNGFDQKTDDSSSNGSSSDSGDGSQEVEEEVTILENAPVFDSVDEDVLASEGPIEAAHMTIVTKLDDPVAECVSEVVEGNILVHDEPTLVASGASADSSISPDVVIFREEGNGEAKLSSPKESAKLSEVTKDLAPEVQKDEKYASLPEVSKQLAPVDKKKETIDVAATSEAAVHKNEETSVLSYNAPRIDTNEDVNGSDAHGSVDSQARVTSAVRPQKVTYWKSCCGLFEAFVGPSR